MTVVVEGARGSGSLITAELAQMSGARWRRCPGR